MSGHEKRPSANCALGSALSTSFLLCFIGTAIFLAALRSAEVYFSGTAWHAFGAGAFLGAALGVEPWRQSRPLYRMIRLLLFAAASVFFFLFLPTLYHVIARSGPEPGPGLFCGIALGSFLLFQFLARFSTILPFAGDSGGALPVVGGMVGVGAARLVHDLFLEGAVSSPTVFVIGLVGIGYWSLARGVHRRPEGACEDRAKPAAPGAFPAGAFFLGAALAAIYPVTRKVLCQISPTCAGTDLMLLCITVGGALLGALFVVALVPAGRWRFLVVLLGTTAFGASLCLLDRQLAFTQDMVRFEDFKNYFSLLHERYVPFAREEVLLYLAFLSIPAFTAGLALCAVRGAWLGFLCGLSLGSLAGTGMLPWTGSASALVVQAILLAAIGATFFARAGLCLERRYFAPFMKGLTVLALAGMWLAVVWGTATFTHSDYRNLPFPGEKELLLFESSSENDLRVVTTMQDRAIVRLDTNYAYFNRGFDWVARLVSRMPSLVGLEGDCLLIGPLAPILAPVVDEAVGAYSDCGERRFSAFETVPALRGASACVAAHEGLEIVDDCGDGGPLSVYLLAEERRFEHILLLPRFSNVDADQGRMSREIFSLVHDALDERGTAWLFVDTTDFGAPAVAGVAAAFGGIFPRSSLWLLEDGLLPPYLLFVGQKGDAVLPGDAIGARIEKMAAGEGGARSKFTEFDDLSEYLIADKDGMQWMAQNRAASSAFGALRPSGLFGDAPGWSAVDDLTKIIPSSSLEVACGRRSGTQEWAMQARRFILGGLSIHGQYTFAIDEKNDIDWELFRAEVGLFAEAFRAHPDTALGRKIMAALMPMLIEANELQVVFETIHEVAGKEPDDVMLRYYLGLVSFKLLDFNEALGHFVAVAEKDPLFVDGAVYAGLTYFALDNKEDAAQYLERAHRLDEQREIIYKPLAISLFDIGRKDEAASFCRKALETMPDDEDLKSLRMLIEDRIIIEEKGEEEDEHKGHDHDHDHFHGG